MITEDVKRELDYRYHYLLGTFGGLDQYLNSLQVRLNLTGFSYRERRETNELSLNVNYLLTHPGSTHVVSPWSMMINLFGDNEDAYQQESIIFDEPYSVYTTKGKLLYSVTGHNGIFGNSLLDKSLILQSQSTDMYYIQYPTYVGTYQTSLVVVNLISLTSPSINQNVDSPITVIKEEIVNQIVFKLQDKNTQLNIYYLASAPVRIPTKEALKENPYSQRTGILINDFDSFIFNPTKSGWITITKQIQTKTNTEEIPIKIRNVLGQGIDRFLNATEDQYVYYLALGSEVDIVAVQNSLGVRSTIPPAVSSSNLINLTADLIL